MPITAKDLSRFRKTLGEKIRILRKLSDMTQADLALRLDYDSTGMVSQIENGIRGMSFERISLAAKVFSVPVEVLLSEKEYCEEDLKIMTKFMKIINLPEDQRPGHFDSIKALLDAIK